MPRFYLHQVRRGERDDRLEESEFSDVRIAFATAIRRARESIAEGSVSGEDMRHARFEIVGEAGQTLLSLPFESAIGQSPSWSECWEALAPADG